MRLSSNKSKINLSKQNIDAVSSVTINELLCAFAFNTNTKILDLFVLSDPDDVIVITYYSIAVFRNQQIDKILGE